MQKPNRTLLTFTTFFGRAMVTPPIYFAMESKTLLVKCQLESDIISIILSISIDQLNLFLHKSWSKNVFKIYMHRKVKRKANWESLKPHNVRSDLLCNCPGPKLITGPKPSICSSLSILSDLKDLCRSRRSPGAPDHRHPKSSSPQRPMPDNETKGGIFSGEGDNC